MSQTATIEWVPVSNGLPPVNKHCDGNQYLVSTDVGTHQTNRSMLEFAVHTGSAKAWAYMPRGYDASKEAAHD